MKPVKTEVVFATPWFEVLGKTMQAGEAPYYSLRLPDYVVVIATTEEGRVLLVRQYRPAVERYTLELPSGLADPGEAPAETARRELLEETGYAAEVELLGPLFVDTGRLCNQLWSYVAKGARPVAAHTPEPGIEVAAYSPEELWRAVKEGEFSLSIHVATLMLGVLHGRLKTP